MKKPVILVVTGPTGSGKTDLSIRLARQLKCSIISADSRQVFKELKIGSAAPDEDQLNLAPHYFIGNKHIYEPFNAGIFEKESLKILETLFCENPVQIVCGGTGLYIDALINGLDELPEIQAGIREEIEEQLQFSGIELLQKELIEKDPEYASQVDLQNPQRLIRALELIRSSGKTYTSLRQRKNPERSFDTIYLATDLPREELYSNINKRTQVMLDKGWLDETKSLVPFRKLNALQTVGYKELFSYIDGDIPYEKAIELIRQNTRRYAKRQITWINNKIKANWVHPLSDENEIIRNYLRN